MAKKVQGDGTATTVPAEVKSFFSDIRKTAKLSESELDFVKRVRQWRSTPIKARFKLK